MISHCLHAVFDAPSPVGRGILHCRSPIQSPHHRRHAKDERSRIDCRASPLPSSFLIVGWNGCGTTVLNLLMRIGNSFGSTLLRQSASTAIFSKLFVRKMLAVRSICDSSVPSGHEHRVDTGLQRAQHRNREAARTARTGMRNRGPVWHELTYGCQLLPRGKRRTALESYLADVVHPSFAVLPYDESAAAWHGRERARLEALGTCAVCR